MPNKILQDEGVYYGRYFDDIQSTKERKKKWTHKIFLYTSDKSEHQFKNLDQVVNVYEHTPEDFEFNSYKIIKHFKKHYGHSSLGMYTLGQSIRFRVYKGQEPIDLPLFKFFVNYTMLLIPITMGMDMTNWRPYTPVSFSTKSWENEIDNIIENVRPLGNIRKITELISDTKYYMNLFCAKCGAFLGISISNNDFIEVAKRSKDAYESITCTFPIEKNIAPSKLERITNERAKNLLNFISEQKDLSLSIFTKAGLFNSGQFKDFAVCIAYKPSISGNTIPFAARSNIIMGLADPRSYVVDSYGGRKAERMKLNVSDAGAFERSNSILMSSIKDVDINYECDSKHFHKKYINDLTALEHVDGRVATLDPNSDEYFIISVHDSKDLVGKTLYIKTPVTCTHPRRSEGVICSACYGKLMSNLNNDIHIGRIAALQISDENTQKLLSAKHSLNTNTVDIAFSERFDDFFETTSTYQICFNQDMIDASAEDSEEFNHKYLLFYLATMKKTKDGENRLYDRYITEINIYDDRDESIITVNELNGEKIYLSQEFNNNYFLDAIRNKGPKDLVYIPFNELIQSGKVCCETLFDYQFKNNDLADPLNTLNDTLTVKRGVAQFETYDEFINALQPMLAKAHIDVPDLQAELLISALVIGKDDRPVDWTLENPEYKFNTINNAIYSSQSALTSILYQESSSQLAGAHNTFEKTGTSAYDYFIYDGK